MCTALTLTTSENHNLFGRNMDIEYFFNQTVIFIPRNYTVTNAVTQKTHTNKYGILGMGTIIANYPTFADVMNEKGLACAGLNFPNFASFPKEPVQGKNNIPVYNFLLWLVSNFATLNEVKSQIGEINLIDEQIVNQVPTAPLHFIVTDKTGESLIIEQTKEGLKWFENPVGVLTNAPTFDWHLTNLRQYSNLNYTSAKNLALSNLQLTPHGQGNGMLGLPGDFSPASRFVRTCVLRDATIKNCENINLQQFFHILSNVAMVKGSVVTSEGKNDTTQYTSCMDLDNLVYYYKTYDSIGMNSISMSTFDLDSTELKTFEYSDVISFNEI